MDGGDAAGDRGGGEGSSGLGPTTLSLLPLAAMGEGLFGSDTLFAALVHRVASPMQVHRDCVGQDMR